MIIQICGNNRLLSTNARCLVIILGGQCNMVDFTWISVARSISVSRYACILSWAATVLAAAIASTSQISIKNITTQISLRHHLTSSVKRLLVTASRYSCGGPGWYGAGIMPRGAPAGRAVINSHTHKCQTKTVCYFLETTEHTTEYCLQ